MIVQLEIDARQLLFPVYIGTSGSGAVTLPTNAVSGYTPDSTKAVLTYTLDSTTQAALYQVWIMAAVRGEILFNLATDGTVTSASAPGTFYQLSQLAPAHWKLTIPGCPITIDGRYLTGPGPIITNQGVPSFVALPFRTVSGGIVPASPGGGYLFEQNSSLTSSVPVNVTPQGTITYPQAQDVAAGGPFAGLQTKTLQLLGIPILLDARAVTTTGHVGIAELSGAITSNCDPAVAFVNVLPLAGTGNQFSITVSDIDLPSVATFQVDATGVVSAQSTTKYLAELDKFHGVSRITILRRFLT